MLLGVTAVPVVALGVPRAATASDPSVASAAASAVSVDPPVQLGVFPVQPPCAFWDTFGAPRPPDRVHEGTDIAAAEGQPVVSVAAGKVTKIFLDSPTNRGGNSMKVTTADGTYYFYAHLSAFADGLKAGQSVAVGQVLGYVGHTGNAAGVNHLHFEAHPGGGRAINPYSALRAIDACKKPAVVASSSVTTAPATVAPPTPPAVAPTPAPPTSAAPPTAAPTTAPATSAAGGPVSTAARLSISAPTRVVNTAVGLGKKAKAGARSTFTVTGVNGVPAAATLVMLTVTAWSPGADGHLAVLPCDAQSTGAATLNFHGGATDSATVLVVPENQQVCVESSVSTNLVIDVVGYDGKWSAGVTSIRPTRLVDAAHLTPGSPLVIKASGVGNVPPANGLSITVSTAGAEAPGKVSVYPCDKKQPKVAQVTVGGDDASTGLNSRLAADGTLCIVSNVAVDVTVDATAAWALGGSNKLRAVVPIRAYDSRATGVVAAGQVVKLAIANDELNWSASVASVVITGLDAAKDGTITAWPCGQNQPVTEAVTVAAGRTVSASAFIGLGGGKLCVSPSTAMNIIVDVTGGA